MAKAGAVFSRPRQANAERVGDQGQKKKSASKHVSSQVRSSKLLTVFQCLARAQMAKSASGNVTKIRRDSLVVSLQAVEMGQVVRMMLPSPHNTNNDTQHV